MTAEFPDHALELRSLVTSQGTLELSLHHVPVPSPAASEVLVRVEASPINPSDLALLIAGADMTTAKVSGTPERPIVTASLGAGVLGGLSARADKSLPVGNEGAGTVVAAGPSSAAQALLGKTVGIAGGAMYTQYRLVDAAACLVLPEGATAKDGASSFVNPLTALGMTQSRRHGGASRSMEIEQFGGARRGGAAADRGPGMNGFESYLRHGRRYGVHADFWQAASGELDPGGAAPTRSGAGSPTSPETGRGRAHASPARIGSGRGC